MNDIETTTAAPVETPLTPEKPKKKKKSRVKGFFKALGYILLTLILLIAIGAVILATMLLLDDGQISSNTDYSVAVDLTEDEMAILDRYVAAVNAAKDAGDFSLAVQTQSEIKDLECSISLFQTMISSIMDSMDTSSSTDESYTFKSGTDTKDETATPLSVIQPAGTLLAEENYGGISAVSSSVDGDTETISFTVAAEEIDMNEIMSIMGMDDMTDMTMAESNEMAQENSEDMYAGEFSMDDIRETEEYSAFISLVPNHTRYFDVFSAMYSVMLGMQSSAFTGEDMQGSEDMQENEDMQGFFTQGDGDAETGSMDESSFSFDGGTMTFGDMQITAVLNGEQLSSVSIAVDFIMNMNVTLMQKSVAFSYTAALSQTYTFSY